MQLIVLAFLILTVIIIYSEVLTESFEIVKEKATLDNKYYYVQGDYPNRDYAANTLAKLIMSAKKLINNLTIKYPKKPEVIRLQEKFKPYNMQEAPHEDDSTSYTINKGQEVHLCIRQKNENKTFHSHNLLMFVMLHELAHIMSKSIGHNQEFMNNFKFLLEEARELGIYIPVNFKHNPAQYCGIEVSNNPIL
jgi:hypothetical protein